PDGPVLKERHSIVELALRCPDRADEDARTAVTRFRREGLDLGARCRSEGGAPHQVLRRITGNKQLGKHDDVSTLRGGLSSRGAHLGGIARKIADLWIELCQSDPER